MCINVRANANGPVFQKYLYFKSSLSRSQHSFSSISARVKPHQPAGKYYFSIRVQYYHNRLDYFCVLRFILALLFCQSWKSHQKQPSWRYMYFMLIDPLKNSSIYMFPIMHCYSRCLLLLHNLLWNPDKNSCSKTFES